MRTALLLALIALCASPQSTQAQVTALRGLRKTAAARPRDARAQTALGMAYLRAGQFKQAERQLKKAVGLPNAGPEATMRVAQVAIAQGNYKLGRGICGRLLGRGEGRTGVAHLCRARAFLAWNRSSRAFDELELAIAQEPDRAEIQLVLGHAHRLRSNVTESEAAYTKAAASEQWAADAHLGLGQLYLAAGREDEGVASLEKALKLAPDWPEIQFALGEELASTERGRQLLAAALEGRPGWSQVATALGDAHLGAGETGKAAAAFRTAIRSDRRSAPGHTGLGRSLLAEGKHDKAEKSLRRALELVPNGADATLALADVLAATDRSEEALEHYRTAYDLNPRRAEPLLKAARLALSLGRSNLASAYLDKLLKLHRDLSAALSLYGDVMKERGQLSRAREYYQRALKGKGEVDRAELQRRLAALK